MVLPNGETNMPTEQSHERWRELKGFDDTMAGVKGVVDGGTTTVPRIFIHPPRNIENIRNKHSQEILNFPLIDLEGINQDSRKRKGIVDKVLDASQTWGFFQVSNHGISVSTLEEALAGVRRFHEQDVGMKKPYYTRDFTRKMSYSSNFDLYSAPATCWRDTLSYIAAPNPPLPEELPPVCREILLKYSQEVMELGITLFKLLSEALGLDSNHLIDIDCAQTLSLLGHYYPACPEPERTLGAVKHADYSFLTVVLQDNLGGLQVLHQNHWVDVVPLAGALVVNIGDLLHLISNDKLRSVEHRVLASHSGPRVSMAAFFGRDTCGMNTRVYGPIEDLLSKENPPKYRTTMLKEYTTYVRNKGVDGRTSALQSFKL